MRPKSGIFGLILAFVFVCALRHEAEAAFATAYDMQSIGLTYGYSGTLGFDFTPLQNIVVKQLGYFDFGQNGFNGGASIGLWQSDGTLIVQTSVSSSDPLNGYYRFAAVTDTLLTAGTTYVIGAHDENDPVTDTRFATITQSPDISFGLAHWYPSSGLYFPDNTAPGFIYTEPNFTYTIATASVPEPAVLLIMAGAALLAPVAIRATKRLGGKAKTK